VPSVVKERMLIERSLHSLCLHPYFPPLPLSPDHEFTQLIKGYQGERLRQAFHFFDRDGDGYISPDEFQRIIMVRWAFLAAWRAPACFTASAHQRTLRLMTRYMQEIAGHKLSDSVLDRLPTLCTMNPGKKISYSEVIAFHNSTFSLVRPGR